jgi:hypothetical protein
VIKASTTNLESSLQEYKELLEQKLKRVATALSYRVASEAIDITPYGNVVRYAELYQKRYDEKGYKVEPGLAKGSWVVSLNTQSSFGAVDYDDPSGALSKKAAMTGTRGFNLGDKIIINNTLDYMPYLEGGNSHQAPYGIRKPALEQIKAVYKIDIQRVLRES